MEIVTCIVLFGTGFLCGVYATSQAEKSIIDKNIVNETIKEEIEGRKEMDKQDQKKETYPEFIKKHYKKRK